METVGHNHGYVRRQGKVVTVGSTPTCLPPRGNDGCKREVPKVNDTLSPTEEDGHYGSGEHRKGQCSVTTDGDLRDSIHSFILTDLKIM